MGKFVTQNCYTREEYLAFLSGRAADRFADEFAVHLESCGECTSVLNDLLGEESSDTIAKLVHDTVLPVADEPTFLDLKKRLLSRAGAAEQRAIPPALDEYELLEPLGQGAMGRVFKARHRRLNRIVALKILAPELLHDPAAVARFFHEMGVVGGLDHPNVIRAIDARSAEGWHFLVLEYIAGLTLAQLLARMARLPAATACEAIRQAALGLQHAHERGLIHRDLKPSNLFVTGDGTVKVLDLGLARLQSADDATTEIVGTRHYMAPEQWTGGEIDIRADLYGLGCTLFKLLTGRPPFGELNRSLDGLGRAHQHEPPPNLRELRPELPPELEQVVVKLLAKDPAARYAAPSELVAALEPLARGGDLAALVRQALSSEEETDRLGLKTEQTIVARLTQAGKRPRRGVLIGGLALAGGLSIWGLRNYLLLPANSLENGWVEHDLFDRLHVNSIDFKSTVKKVTRAGRDWLEVSGNTFTLIRFGENLKPPFSMFVTYETKSTGRGGVYFGHQQTGTPQGTFKQHFQIIQVGDTAIEKIGKPPRDLELEMGITQTGSGSTGSSHFRDNPIEWDYNLPQQELLVEIRKEDVIVLTWNGKQITKPVVYQSQGLTLKGITLEGGFGLIVKSGVIRFGKFFTRASAE